MVRKTISYTLIYGLGLGLLSVLMYWGRYRLMVVDHAMELYALLVGVIFVMVGAWLGNKLSRPKTIIQHEIVIREVQVPAPSTQQSTNNQACLEGSGISQREFDVLQLLAKGLSNEEIAAHLFVSQNTVKTHLSNLYFKLDVKRRTQAVDKARSIGLIS